jgi:ABC-2 type transport system ATP-binding protein
LEVTKLLNQPVRELSLGERMKMELIAALLHRPEVLFLDEPTIGLDVVAQHNIQQFLKHYQEERRTTVLLTSHYMKDIAALCRRVVIIAHGRLMYDGSLAGIVDRFSGHKVLTLQFADDHMPNDLSRFGEPLDSQSPKARIKVEREKIAAVLSSVLGSYQVADVSVEDPPLEEVIAEMFATATNVSNSQELAKVS